MESNKKIKGDWICCHIGARAHYQFARAIDQSGNLSQLITEVWIPEGWLKSLLKKIIPSQLVKKILERSHSSINSSLVKSFTLSSLLFEARNKIRKNQGWSLIIKRNDWFQNKIKKTLMSHQENDLTIFCFAYTALKPFEYAKSKGWKTVLYQMDPGIEEENIVKQENQKNDGSGWNTAPAEYWNQWKMECMLADKIIVNSNWSKKALISQNIPEEKIKIIPLSHEPGKESDKFQREYPETFTRERPMRVLFLGTLTIRKGMRPLMEAIRLMDGLPVEFWFVGHQEMILTMHKQIKYFQQVSREDTSAFYRKADVFIFPTLSDGFGLTQLEAFEWKLPVISSVFCGDVVEDNVNGLIISELSGKAIRKAILYCYENPHELERFSGNTSKRLELFSLKNLENQLSSIHK